MKKLLSMLLTVLMLFSMCAIPAFAEEAEVPLYEQFGYASEEEFMEGEFWYMSQRGFTYEDACAIYEEKYTEILENPQIALDYFGITEEDVAADWDDPDEYYRWIALLLTTDESYFFVPPVSVQLDGEEVIFPDAAPEITDGRTMVPFRAIAEEMGFTVSYDEGAIVGSDGETSVAFTVGETSCVVTKPSGEETVTMDTAPYIKEDRTYVPVRFFAEAFGMTVAWDGEYQTAVIYDKDVWIERIDQDFTVYNKLLALESINSEAPEDFEMAISMAMNITRISSLDGNTTYPVNFDVTVVKEGNKIQGTMLLDIFELFKLTAAESGLDEEQMEAAFLGMEDYLKDIEAELIVNLDEGKCYFHCPLVNYILAMEGGLSITDVNSAWLSLELPDMEEISAGFAEIYAQAGNVKSVGELLMFVSAPEEQYYPSKGLETLLEVKDIFALLYGDSVFTQKGDEYTATWDYTLDELTPEDSYSEGGYLKGTMKLNTKTGKVSLNMEMRVDSYSGDTLIKITADGKGNDVHMTMMVHMENQMIIEYEMDTKMTDVKTSPLSEPPKGAVIIDMNEL